MTAPFHNIPWRTTTYHSPPDRYVLVRSGTIPRKSRGRMSGLRPIITETVTGVRVIHDPATRHVGWVCLITFPGHEGPR